MVCSTLGAIMILEEFNLKYSYQSDTEKYGTSLDVWEIIEPDSEGNYRGDCESYARTLKNLVSEFKDWEYYYCKLYGEGHCVLYKDGKVIDCNIRKIISLEDYCKVYNVTEFRKYSILQVACKVLVAKGYLWTRFLKN